eukprot:gene15279-18475_t
MTAIQICALISIATATGILYWIGYRGGLADGRVEGYENGQDDGFSLGFEQAKEQCAVSITQAHEQRQRIELLLSREPQDRLTLLLIAEKLKLAAETFKAVNLEHGCSNGSMDTGGRSMSREIPVLRLTPQAAGSLKQQYDKVSKELRELTRYYKEFDRQLKARIGSNAVRQLHKETDNALLLTDLVKEAA